MFTLDFHTNHIRMFIEICHGGTLDNLAPKQLMHPLTLKDYAFFSKRKEKFTSKESKCILQARYRITGAPVEMHTQHNCITTTT